MPTDRAYVTNTLVPRLLRYLRKKGVDVVALSQRFELPPDAEDRTEMRVRGDHLIALMDAASQALGDPDLGLHLAGAVNLGDYGLIEFVVRSTPTMRDALIQTVRYMGLVEDAVVPRLAEVRGDAVFEYSPVTKVDLGPHINAYILGVIIRLGRIYVGAPWPLKRVWFSNPKPANLNALTTFFETDALEFDARSVGVRFDAALLERRIPTADAALHAFLERQAKEKIQDQPTVPFMARVREKLAAGMATGNVQVERIATAMHCSARTLQRRLTEEGTSFQEVLDDARHEQALILLQTHHKPVGEVAFLLGYSDLRPFVRAFKRWTGRTPAEVRDAPAVHA